MPKLLGTGNQWPGATLCHNTFEITETGVFLSESLPHGAQLWRPQD